MANDLGFEECICGRMAAKAHCPHCGSYDVYARSPKHNERIMDTTTGEPRSVATFRCKKCSMFFNMDQWKLFCTAPPYVKRAVRLQEQQTKDITNAALAKDTTGTVDRQMIDALNLVLSKRGEQPIKPPPRASDTMFDDKDQDK